MSTNSSLIAKLRAQASKDYCRTSKGESFNVCVLEEDVAGGDDFALLCAASASAADDSEVTQHAHTRGQSGDSSQASGMFSPAHSDCSGFHEASISTIHNGKNQKQQKRRSSFFSEMRNALLGKPSSFFTSRRQNSDCTKGLLPLVNIINLADLVDEQNDDDTIVSLGTDTNSCEYGYENEASQDRSANEKPHQLPESVDDVLIDSDLEEKAPIAENKAAVLIEPETDDEL